VSAPPDQASDPPQLRSPYGPLAVLRSHVRPSEIAQRFGLVFAWALVVLIFSLLRPSTFPTIANFSTIFGTQAVILVLTLGILIPLTAGDYDLSIAATLTLSTMIVAILNVNHHWNIYLTILVALGVGGLVGFINGGIVVLVGIDPFIVTLGTGTFIQGVVLWISQSETISGVSDTLVNAVVVNQFLSIPLEFWYGIALMVVLWYVSEYTPVGRRLLFVGRGRSVSRLSGIHVGRTRWAALVASGLISAGAGVLYAGTTGAADPTSGLQFLLPAFAAAFLGATAIYPGRFNPIGATIAVFFLITGITGLQLLGAQSYVQQLFYGGALVLAVALTHLAGRRQSGAGVPTSGA
jgi:ribose transport system permease protein